MEQHTDGFGTELNVGDHIIFISSYNRGNTTLKKAEIIGFTPKGRAMINKKIFDYQYYKDTKEYRYDDIPKAVMAFYAKAVDGKESTIQ